MLAIAIQVPTYYDRARCPLPRQILAVVLVITGIEPSSEIHFRSVLCGYLYYTLILNQKPNHIRPKIPFRRILHAKKSIDDPVQQGYFLLFSDPAGSTRVVPCGWPLPTSRWCKHGMEKVCPGFVG